MKNLTELARATKEELLSELCDHTNHLAGLYRSLSTTNHDFTIHWYNAYANAPTNSVAGKEREANYQCTEFLNEISHDEAEIKVFEKTIEVIMVLIDARS